MSGNLEAVLANVLGTAQASPALRNVLPRVLRALAEEGPLTRDRLEDLPGWQPGLWDQLVDWGADVNGNGSLVGIAGLSIPWTPHKVSLASRTLYAWCALDTLILPSLLEEPLNVVSVCPATSVPIHLRITPDGIESAEPADAVMSIVLPRVTDTAEGDACFRPALVGRTGIFCSRVWFFTSSEAGSSWLGQTSDGRLLELDDAWRLAQALWVTPLTPPAS